MSDINSTSLATKIERSENKLTNALSKCGVSLPGQSWIDHAYDIFKDDEGRSPCVGQPDSSNRLIYVSTYTSQVTISRPASVPAGSTWDCHAINLQQNNLTQVRQTVFTNNNSTLINVALPVVNYGGLQILTGPAGGALGLSSTAANLTLPDSYFRGQVNAKVIGKAHQILNTTNALSVQGDLMYYEKTETDPQDTITAVNVSLTTANSDVNRGVMDVYNNVSAINTQAELIVLPKTRKILAKQGIYQTVVLCSNDNDAQTDRPIGQLITGVAGSRWITSPDWTQTGQNINHLYFSPGVPNGQSPFVSPFNVSGSYLSGLSSDTTLVFTAKWMVEVSPPLSDSKMISLSHQSPPRDDCALEVYFKIAHSLPAGTEIKNNAAGDWIATIADLATMAGVPGVAVIKKGVELANKFYQSDFAKMTNPSSTQGSKIPRSLPEKFTTAQWNQASNYNQNLINKGKAYDKLMARSIVVNQQQFKKNKSGNQKLTNNKNLKNNNSRLKK